MKRLIIAAVVLALVVGVGGIACSGGNTVSEQETGKSAAKTPQAVRPTDKPAPTKTPLPTSTPAPPPTFTPQPLPIVLEGVGQTATEPVTPPASISRAVFTHNGSSNFIVKSYQGGNEELLINEIGPYQGQRPILSQEPVFFDISADGAWTLRIEPLGTQNSPAFSGRGDAVSDLFWPASTSPAAWSITHTGESNFIVKLHCAGGSDLIQNEIGRVAGSRVIQFEDGPCIWEVQADGAWSLAPR